MLPRALMERGIGADAGPKRRPGRTGACGNDRDPKGVRRCGVKKKGVFERMEPTGLALICPTYRCRKRLRPRKRNGTRACRETSQNRAPQPGGEHKIRCAW